MSLHIQIDSVSSEFLWKLTDDFFAAHESAHHIAQGVGKSEPVAILKSISRVDQQLTWAGAAVKVYLTTANNKMFLVQLVRLKNEKVFWSVAHQNQIVKDGDMSPNALSALIAACVEILNLV